MLGGGLILFRESAGDEFAPEYSEETTCGRIARQLRAFRNIQSTPEESAASALRLSQLAADNNLSDSLKEKAESK